MGFFLQAFEAALSFEQANSSIRGVAENWAAERPVGTGRDRARNTTYQGLNFKKHSFVRDLNAEGFVFFLFHVAFSFECSLLGFKQIQASLLRCLCMFYSVCVCVCVCSWIRLHLTVWEAFVRLLYPSARVCLVAGVWHRLPCTAWNVKRVCVFGKKWWGQ